MSRELECLNTIAYRDFIRTAPLAELIGIDDLVAPTNYTKSASYIIRPNSPEVLYSGKITSVKLVSYETGSGAVQKPAGVLLFFEADPQVAVNATALAVNGADHKKIIGEIPIIAADWDADANGAIATALVAVFFKNINSIFAAFRLDATAPTHNDVGADNELLELGFDFNAYPPRLED